MPVGITHTLPCIVDIDVHVPCIPHAAGDHGIRHFSHGHVVDVLLKEVPTVPTHRRSLRESVRWYVMQSRDRQPLWLGVILRGLGGYGDEMGFVADKVQLASLNIAGDARLGFARAEVKLEVCSRDWPFHLPGVADRVYLSCNLRSGLLQVQIHPVPLPVVEYPPRADPLTGQRWRRLRVRIPTHSKSEDYQRNPSMKLLFHCGPLIKILRSRCGSGGSVVLPCSDD